MFYVSICSFPFMFHPVCIYTMDISIHAFVFIQAIAKHST